MLLEKSQAIACLKLGIPLTHVSWNESKWLRLLRINTYKFSDGTKVSVEEFWKSHEAESFKDGWRISTTEGRTMTEEVKLFSKEEAAAHMNNGARVTHTSWTDDEWVRQTSDTECEYEDGVKETLDNFWAIRDTVIYEGGWSLVTGVESHGEEA